MNRFAVTICCGCLVAFVAAAGPEEDFASLLLLIQKGDRLVQEVNDRQAMDSYRQAQSALLNFRKVYPAWDPQVVDFRLRYLGDRLGNWSPPNTADTSNGEPETQALRNRVSYLERANEQYQQQLNQLHAENNRLTMRLREALAIRPAAQDPAVLAETTARLANATEEVTRLTARVEALEKELAATPNPEQARSNARLLEESRKKLGTAQATAEALRQENQTLRRRRPVPGNAAPALKEDLKTGEQLIAARVALKATEIELQRLRDQNQKLTLQLTAIEAIKRTGGPTSTGDGPSSTPKNADAARLALSVGRIDEAIRLMESETGKSPGNAEAWYLLGRARMLNHQYAESEAALTKALDLTPDLAVAHFEMARLQRLLQPADAALSRWHYHKAIALGHPRDAALEKEIDWESSADGTKRN